jgi:hypothetical protein
MCSSIKHMCNLLRPQSSIWKLNRDLPWFVCIIQSLKHERLLGRPYLWAISNVWDV